ncbi:nitroreductase family protein [Roseococcus sp. YIM B11640]|uniref:nitroreductase family protein n=1 Tax=Roseococcus sp. YIM B11640 TaxID=3133973 RepID=UPI003C7C0816
MDINCPPLATKPEALTLRYGADAIPAAGPWNEHIALLLSHRSVRGFRPDALPEGTLETMVAAAQSAATSSNMQTWSVVAVDDPAVRAEFARIAGGQKHIEQCPLFLLWLADLSRNERVAAAQGAELEALPYLETFVVAAIDAALAAQNAVVAAESLGLSTVYIGAMRNDPARVAELLKLPAGVVGVFGLCVGYAASGVTNEVKPRLPQEAILHRGTYGAVDEPAMVASYDAKLDGFSSRYEASATTWSGRVINRMGRIKAMAGRDRLSEILKGLGFPLR